MKKIFAIAMLMLLLFNVGGYQLLFQYFIYRSDNVITRQINYNQYKPTDLVEVKIPVHLNMESWDGFRPIGGQIRVKNKVYNYAQLRMTRDTMYLMCVLNYSKASLIQASIIYGKQVNDLSSGKKTALLLIKKNISESYYTCNIRRFSGLTLIERAKERHNHPIPSLANAAINVVGEPPDAYPCSSNFLIRKMLVGA